MEVAIRDGWVRYWHKGELLPLPLEREAELGEMRKRFDEERSARLRAEEEAERATKEANRLTQEKERAEKEKERAEKEKERAEKEKDQAEQRARKSEQDAERLQRQLTDRDATLVATLRPFVEARARQAGRQDVLDQLAATTDGEQLARWLAEMG
jgi:hypothetical protein